MRGPFNGRFLVHSGEASRSPGAIPARSWKVYDPNDPAGSTLTQLCPNYGYWIKVNQAGTMERRIKGTSLFLSLRCLSHLLP